MPVSAKVASFDIASLYKVRSEISSSLSTLEMNLGEFVDDKSLNYILSDSAEELVQIRSVLKLIELSGSEELTTALIDGLKHLEKTADNTNAELINAISEAVMTLNRYIEFVLLKEQIYPKLLLNAINSLRLSLRQPLLGESAFDKAINIANDASVFSPVASFAQSASLLRRAFRIGLSQAIGYKNIGMSETSLQNLKMMQLACQHAVSAVGGKFWQIALIAVTDIEKALPLTPSKLRALIFVEAQFANNTSQVDKSGLSDLINMAASRSSDAAAQLRQAYQIETLDDAKYTEMYHFMFGPNSEVVDTVNELVQQEINEAKNMVDAEARQSELSPENVKKIAVALRDLSLRLFTLGLKNAAEIVMKQAKVVSGWRQANPEQFKQLLSALLYAENATVLMANQHSAGQVSLPLNNTGISLHQLDTAFDVLLQESRNTLANVVNSVTAYIESPNKDILHLSNVPTMLSSVGGALLFVDVSKGHKLLHHAAKYMDAKVKAQQDFDEQTLAKIADIVMSADYYLESIELKQPSGDQPLIIGAKSLKSLLTAA